MPDRETFFITGFPGFIANRLLERLARQECNFILLVQPSLVSRAHEEIARIAPLTGRSVADFQIVEGDIAEPQLALKKSDLDLALGNDFAGTVPNNYRLVREAIDRGVPLDEVKPGNNISVQLRKLMLPQQAAKAPAADAQGLIKKLSMSLAK